MERHIKILGIIHIVHSLLGIMVGASILALLSGIGLLTGDFEAAGILAVIGGRIRSTPVAHRDSGASRRHQPSDVKAVVTHPGVGAGISESPRSTGRHGPRGLYTVGSVTRRDGRHFRTGAGSASSSRGVLNAESKFARKVFAVRRALEPEDRGRIERPDGQNC